MVISSHHFGYAIFEMFICYGRGGAAGDFVFHLSREPFINHQYANDCQCKDNLKNLEKGVSCFASLIK